MRRPSVRGIAPLRGRRHNDIFESLLDRPREATLLCQDEREGYGEGLDLGVTYLTLKQMRDEAVAERVQLVSGRKETETWKEAAAAGPHGVEAAEGSGRGGGGADRDGDGAPDDDIFLLHVPGAM